ncbi:MAG: ATP synthase F1 subunit epsilon [Oscillospiraceae bacterium]|nr:ATP synthase F1 subunit epsilon [Oscillospiraceae bacterium]MDD4367908.1 ATP synthase F1 subunit epsilon [Oscillospiraceae bacterium]
MSDNNQNAAAAPAPAGTASVNTFRLTVVTPYQVFWDDPCGMLIFTAADGEMGIMANHTPMVAALYPGELRIRRNGQWSVAFVSNGYVQVESNYVIVVTNAAEWPEDIDLKRAQSTIDRGRERINKPDASEDDIKIGRHAVRRGQKRLELAEKYAGRPQGPRNRQA